MNVSFHQVVVAGELPRIGSGYRIVRAQFGKKWVHVSDLDGEGRTRMTLKAWSQIKQLGELDRDTVLKGLRRADRALGRKARRALA